MLGWPSPMYPRLLSTNSVIPITLDQTALLAGMLMYGYALATPLGGIKYINHHTGFPLSSFIIFSGWTTMYFATNFTLLCVSRCLVGLGTGFGISKTKFYSKTLGSKLKIIIPKYIPVFIGFGVLNSFVLGHFLTFRQFSIMAAFVAILILFISLFIPKIDDKTESTEKNSTIFDIITNKTELKSFFILVFVITIQQFTGGPSLIVYSQIVFKTFDYTHPYIYSIFYVLLFILQTYLGLRYMPNFNRKPVLLISLTGSIIALVGIALYLFFKPMLIYYKIVPVISMSLFVISHTIGLTIVPLLLVNDLFVEKSRYTINCFLQMYTVILAVIVTKIFQVFFTYYDMYVAFSFLASVGLFGFFTVCCFFKETKNSENNK